MVEIGMDQGGKVVQLVTPAPRDAVARAQVVGVLAELLERAKAGEFLDVALVASDERGNTAMRWAPLQDPTRTVGQLHLLAHLLLHNHATVDR